MGSYLECQNEIRQVGVVFELEFFSEAVTTDLHSPYRDVHQRGNLLARNIQPKVGAKLQLAGGKVGICFFQPKASGIPSQNYFKEKVGFVFFFIIFERSLLITLPEKMIFFTYIKCDSTQTDKNSPPPPNKLFI